MRLLGVIALAALTHAALAAGPTEWVPRLLSAEEAAEGFYPLFNGENLDGWSIRGDNHRAYAAQDGNLAITGQGNGGWMFTERAFANFVLRLEYKLDAAGGNSGIALRAAADGEPSITGVEIQVVAPIAPSVESSGAIFGAVPPQAQADKPAGEWNAMEIVCDGARVQTTLNGQMLYDVNLDSFDRPTADGAPLKDRMREGFIALQDHAEHVEFRNVRIKPLPGGPGWQPLFNGADLTGWKVVNAPAWSVTPEGLLRFDGSGQTWTEQSILHTETWYGDFELRLSARTGDKANSGVFLRSVMGTPPALAYEAQINHHDPVFFTGALFDQAPATELRAADNHWFQMHITADGPKVSVAVNGKTVVVFDSPKHAGNESGVIALQGREPGSIVEFKNIEIRPIAH